MFFIELGGEISFFPEGLQPQGAVKINSEVYQNLMIDNQKNGKKIVADKNGLPLAVPQNYIQKSSGEWVYDASLELLSTKVASVEALKQLDDIYRKKKDGAFAVDMTATINNLNIPNNTDILFPTSQASFNITNTPKPATCQNQKIVGYSTNKIKYPTHDRCVLWVQDSRDIQSLVSLGHVLAADWASKNNSSIFDYIHYQQIGIAGVQYRENEIRTLQPDGYPVVLDKHSLRMWMFILEKTNEKKEQLHGRYLLLKTQIQNCTTMDSLESVVKSMSTGWVEVFSDMETPAGMTVIR